MAKAISNHYQHTNQQSGKDYIAIEHVHRRCMCMCECNILYTLCQWPIYGHMRTTHKAHTNTHNTLINCTDNIDFANVKIIKTMRVCYITDPGIFGIEFALHYNCDVFCGGELHIQY